MPPVIRPFNPPQVPSQTVKTPTVRPAADVRAAQRAFFQQAIGDTTPASASTAVQPAVSRAIAPAVTRVKTQPIPEEKPAGYLRPGSFIDIKV